MGWRAFLRSKVEQRGQPALLIGGAAEQLLHQHFRIVRKLGAGSFSTAYEVERLTDGRHYALKATDLQALSRLDRQAVVEEIRLLASLSHPNIIHYFEAFCDHDKLCVVTELVAGGDLCSYLSKLRDREDFLWERQVWALFLQAALGVQYLHHNHVLHRDLKPQNIMLTRRGEPGGPGQLLKIADLGVSAELARVFTRVQIGTPHYMAPEMWRRQPYSYSADVWALGCILHELCTLRPAFLAEGDRTEEDIKRRVLAGRYGPLPSRYSVDLSHLVALMLHPDPKERPTIDEILAMPAVKARLQHLPPELQPLAAAAAEGGASAEDRSPLESAVKLPEDPAGINCLLPPARYATGGGLAELLCGRPPQRRSLSLSDLQTAESAGQAVGQHASGRASQGSMHHAKSAGDGLVNRSAAASSAGGGSSSVASGAREPSPTPGEGCWAEAGRGLHRGGASMNDLALEEQDNPRLRRRSIMVGELLFRLQQEQADRDARERRQQGGGGEGGGEGDGSHAAGSEAGGGGEAGEGDSEAGTPPFWLQERMRVGSMDAASQQAGRSQRPPTPPTPDPHGHSQSPQQQQRWGSPAGQPPASAQPSESGGQAAGQAEEDREQPRSSVARRSVAVAEVLHYEESRLKRQVLDGGKAGERDSIAELARTLPPLAREPFEFCAEPSPGASGRPNAAQPAASTAGGSGGAQAPASAAPSSGGGSSVGGVVQPPAKKEGKQKKKHGRLWRLMYGEGDSGMHQDWA